MRRPSASVPLRKFRRGGVAAVEAEADDYFDGFHVQRVPDRQRLPSTPPRHQRAALAARTLDDAWGSAARPGGAAQRSARMRSDARREVQEHSVRMGRTSQALRLHAWRCVRDAVGGEGRVRPRGEFVGVAPGIG